MKQDDAIELLLLTGATTPDRALCRIAMGGWPYSIKCVKRLIDLGATDIAGAHKVALQFKQKDIAEFLEQVL